MGNRSRWLTPISIGPSLDLVYTLCVTAGFSDLVQVRIAGSRDGDDDSLRPTNLRVIGAGSAGTVPGGLGRAPGLAGVMSLLKHSCERLRS